MDVKFRITYSSLFESPRRFGKTLNMDMFRVFLKYQTKILQNTLEINPAGNVMMNIVPIGEATIHIKKTGW